MSSTWILFVVIYGYSPLTGTVQTPVMTTQVFHSEEHCDSAKKAILESLVLPEEATVKAVCVEDKGPKTL